MSEKRSPIAKTGQVLRSGAKIKTQKNLTTTDLQAQRKRLLDYLRKKGAATTIKIRKELNIISPAPRIFELRAQGYPIETHWLNDSTTEGYQHRVANYILPGDKHSEEKYILTGE